MTGPHDPNEAEFDAVRLSAERARRRHEQRHRVYCDQEGRLIFCPLGSWGETFFVADLDVLQAAPTRQTKSKVLHAGLAGLLTGLFFYYFKFDLRLWVFSIQCLSILLMCLLDRSWARRRLTPSPTRLTLDELTIQRALTRDPRRRPWMFYGLAALSLALFLSAVLLASFGHTRRATYAALVGCGFFSGSLQVGYLDAIARNMAQGRHQLPIQANRALTAVWLPVIVGLGYFFWKVPVR